MNSVNAGGLEAITGDLDAILPNRKIKYLVEAGGLGGSGARQSDIGGRHRDRCAPNRCARLIQNGAVDGTQGLLCGGVERGGKRDHKDKAAERDPLPEEAFHKLPRWACNVCGWLTGKRGFKIKGP